MPAYNSEAFIRKALSSIPKRDDIEIIVVNDGSTDNTAAIAKEFNVKLIDRKENMGIGYSRREALAAAQGEYIMFFDSDDTIIQENFNIALDMLTGEDIVYYDLKQNDGVVLHLTPNHRTDDLLVFLEQIQIYNTGKMFYYFFSKTCTSLYLKGFIDLL
jgi:glycosyltransferase involved in cell wall biosynthesis